MTVIAFERCGFFWTVTLVYREFNCKWSGKAEAILTPAQDKVPAPDRITVERGGSYSFEVLIDDLRNEAFTVGDAYRRAHGMPVWPID